MEIFDRGLSVLQSQSSRGNGPLYFWLTIEVQRLSIDIRCQPQIVTKSFEKWINSLVPNLIDILAWHWSPIYPMGQDPFFIFPGTKKKKSKVF